MVKQVIWTFHFIIHLSIYINTKDRSICSINKFEGLNTSQSYDAEMLESLNSWAHKVRNQNESRQTKSRKTKSLKTKSVEDWELDKLSTFVSSHKKPKAQSIVVLQSDREVSKAADVIKPLPHDRKAMTKVVNWVSKRVQFAPDERLVMVDSGSFCHAINASVDLAGHKVTPIGPNEKSGDGESACGGVMKRTGRVQTKGTVAGKSLNVKWNAMDVKVPILLSLIHISEPTRRRGISDGGLGL